MLTRPNLLVLDEPTDHLDIASRDALERAVSEYSGTVIAVSYDRYFLDNTVNCLLVLNNGRVTKLLGSYTENLEQINTLVYKK